MTYLAKQQQGHFDPTTAYVIERYPYSFGQFTSIRYWVDTKPAYGQRLMTQIQNPATGEWWKPKTEGYSDIVVIITNDDPTAKNYGFVIQPSRIDLKEFDLPTLLQFAQYYTFTPGQKQTIMKALNDQNYYTVPKWCDEIPIDYHAAKRTEVPTNIQKVGIRQTTNQGIPTQSMDDAVAAERRTRRAQYPSSQVQPTQPTKPKSKPQEPIEPGHDEDLSSLTPEQQAFARSLLDGGE